jgi:hypothetical protein
MLISTTKREKSMINSFDFMDELLTDGTVRLKGKAESEIPLLKKWK